MYYWRREKKGFLLFAVKCPQILTPIIRLITPFLHRSNRINPLLYFLLLSHRLQLFYFKVIEGEVLNNSLEVHYRPRSKFMEYFFSKVKFYDMCDCIIGDNKNLNATFIYL